MGMRGKGGMGRGGGRGGKLGEGAVRRKEDARGGARPPPRLENARGRQGQRRRRRRRGLGRRQKGAPEV
eukprot:8235658-Pyramimonas_sp.AAC.1